MLLFWLLGHTLKDAQLLSESLMSGELSTLNYSQVSCKTAAVSRYFCSQIEQHWPITTAQAMKCHYKYKSHKGWQSIFRSVFVAWYIDEQLKAYQNIGRHLKSKANKQKQRHWKLKTNLNLKILILCKSNPFNMPESNLEWLLCVCVLHGWEYVILELVV